MKVVPYWTGKTSEYATSLDGDRDEQGTIVTFTFFTFLKVIGHFPPLAPHPPSGSGAMVRHGIWSSDLKMALVTQMRPKMAFSQWRYQHSPSRVTLETYLYIWNAPYLMSPLLCGPVV